MVLTQFRSSASQTTYMIIHNVYASKMSRQIRNQVIYVFPKALYFLFILYVNDLPQYVQNHDCNIFADDAIIYSFGTNIKEISCKMQGTLDSIMPWYDKQA